MAPITWPFAQKWIPPFSRACFLLASQPFPTVGGLFHCPTSPPATAYSSFFSQIFLFSKFPSVLVVNLLNQLISLRIVLLFWFFLGSSKDILLSTFAVEPFIAAGCLFQCLGRFWFWLFVWVRCGWELRWDRVRSLEQLLIRAGILKITPLIWTPPISMRFSGILQLPLRLLNSLLTG